MLDDRTTTPDPQLLPFLTWTYDDNVTGWGAYSATAPAATTCRRMPRPPAPTT